MKIWSCKIGECDAEILPDGADAPMRQAVERAYREITGFDAAFIFSGWGAELDESERAVVENREPSPEHYALWLKREAAPGYIAGLIDCQGALVRALNTAMNALGEAGRPAEAHAARVARDAALAELRPPQAHSDLSTDAREAP